MSGSGLPVHQAAAEPLLPGEKKLIAVSLGTGIVLLVLMTIATRLTAIF